MRPTRDETLMGTAKLWAARSTCSRAQVGAVVSREGRSLANGYNGAPAGMAHCDHGCNCVTAELPPETSSLAELNYHQQGCNYLEPCGISVHAEVNVIAFAAKNGVSLDGAEMHTTRVPCTNCAMLIINAGIKRVVWEEKHRDMAGLNLLIQAGLEVIEFNHCVCWDCHPEDYEGPVRWCPVHGERK